MLTAAEPQEREAPAFAAVSSSLAAPSRASSPVNSAKNDSRVSLVRGPLFAGAAAVSPMTRGTRVCVVFPENCLISTASTSILSRVCSLRNDTIRVKESGMSFGYEQEADPPRGEVRTHVCPEGVDVRLLARL